jgi:hypothetical protein
MFEWSREDLFGNPAAMGDAELTEHLLRLCQIVDEAKATRVVLLRELAARGISHASEGPR